jgi:hypothetical protein
MSSVSPVGVDLSTGQQRQFSSRDILSDSAGNPKFNQVLSTVTGIDATTVAEHNLYTVQPGTNVMVTEVLVVVTAASAVTTPATVGVGIAGGADDIVSSQELVALTTANTYYSLDVNALATTGTGTDIIKFGIDTAAAGTAHSQTFTVILIGTVVLT